MGYNHFDAKHTQPILAYLWLDAF